jgi:hypothetical protein
MSDNARTTASASNGRSVGLANLKPWQKGVSGNPQGRPPAAIDVAELARKHGPKCVDVISRLLDDDDPKMRLAAATALLDRGFGKPRQEVSNDTKDERSFTFLHLVAARASGEQLRAAINQPNAPQIEHSEHGSVDLMAPAVE